LPPEPGSAGEQETPVTASRRTRARRRGCMGMAHVGVSTVVTSLKNSRALQIHLRQLAAGPAGDWRFALWANLVMRAVPASAGARTLVLQYRPPRLQAGLAAAALAASFILAALLWAGVIRAARRRGRAP
jgi:hypothetical protein